MLLFLRLSSGCIMSEQAVINIGIPSNASSPPVTHFKIRDEDITPNLSDF